MQKEKLSKAGKLKNRYYFRHRPDFKDSYNSVIFRIYAPEKKRYSWLL
ncbi:hypothetical protein NG798_08685 [Ancylothrix sp. C2]|nr:hypothetical protein [Ancylothrix sp. D3o]